jgi:hypothetical protein
MPEFGEPRPRGWRLTAIRRRFALALIPALWLIADAAVAAVLPALAVVLLLFLLNPELPLTLGAAASSVWSLLPQTVVLFILTGPCMVLMAVSLQVGQTTGRGLRTSYIVRFMLFDFALIVVSCARAWQQRADLLPASSQLWLMLLAATCGAAVAMLLAWLLVPRREARPGGTPAVVAIGLAVLISLVVIGNFRRVRPIQEQPQSLPGFVPTERLVVIEIPGLDGATARRAIEKGLTPTVEMLVAGGVTADVDPGAVSAPLAVHTTLITGRPAVAHGVLSDIRRGPTGHRVSFALLPSGLLIRRTTRWGLWRTESNGASAVRTVSAPQMLDAIGVHGAWIGEPLGWQRNATQLVIPERALQIGERLELTGLPLPVTCEDPRSLVKLFFDQEDASLDPSQESWRAASRAFGSDLCALAAARVAVLNPEFDWVWVRLSGYSRMAIEFAGYQPESPARGVRPKQFARYGRTLLRALRELDTALAPVVEAAGSERRFLLISPQAIRPRDDFGRLIEALSGQTGPTATWAGPQPGVMTLTGRGVRAGTRLDRAVQLDSVLATLLWASGLPTAENMGPIEQRAFDPAYVADNGVVAIPSYGRAVR